MPIELGYWKLRGLAGNIKLLLEYTGADWKDTQFDNYQKEDGSWDRSEWLSVKESEDHQNKFNFPNLPFLVDGDVHLSQSTTILKYIARKFKVGDNLTETEAWRVDLATDQLADARSMCAGFFYMGNMNQKDAFCDNQLTPVLKQFDRFLANVKFVAGEKITYVDFSLWEWLDHIELFDETVFEGLENLKAFKARFADLPKIKAYTSSDQFMKTPLNGKAAKWGGDKELTRPWQK